MKTLEEQRAYNNAKQRRWRLNNPEKVKERDRRNYWKNREKFLEKNRVYKEQNPEYFRQYTQENKERLHNYYRKYFLNNHLRVRVRKHNLSEEALGLMELQQQSRCAICGRTETMVRNGHKYALAIDHNHTTGVIRELLCQSCNQGIGKFKDDPKLLRAAADYLESHA